MKTREIPKAAAQISRLLIDTSTLTLLEEKMIDRGRYERCGFLLGTLSEDSALVKKAIFMRNTAELGDYFSINPLEQARVFRASTESEQVLGIFHSHRKSPEPSPKDIENMSLFPFIWLIFGYTDKRSSKELCRVAWRQINGRVEKIKIFITDRRLDKCRTL